MRTALSSGASAGQTTLGVVESSSFSAGQDILVIQMQGQGAGNYEFATISSVNAGSLALQSSLSRSYAQDGGSSRAQVLLVRHFDTVSGSLTTGEWNGSTGGVVAFRAKTISNATVDVSSKGFKGGYGNDSAVHGGYVDGVPQICPSVGDGLAQQGSSPSGVGGCTESPNEGGGGGSRNFGSGGGGGHGSGGGDGSGSGGSPGRGGSPYGSADLSTIFLGSGGGGGTWGTNPYGGGRRSGSDRSNDSSGQGGGIAIVLGEQVNGLTVIADGAAGGPGGAGYGGGGGAGGSVKVTRGGGTQPALRANGGSGGTGGLSAGGAGGTGRTLNLVQP